ncbi:potassium transport protein TRK1/TRK2 [Hortaea werneckii]|nr:potassium transport protein TRK1/TRK2 [Hortaea werneckii]
MWRPRLDFITIHYAYILSCTIFAFIILYPNGGLRPIDAFFFGASANTESGLNTIDVKALHIYQQLVLYFFPMVTNLGFINIIVVVVRLWYFEKHMKQKYPNVFKRIRERSSDSNSPASDSRVENGEDSHMPPCTENETTREDAAKLRSSDEYDEEAGPARSAGRITWATGLNAPPQAPTLKIPSPKEREKGVPIHAVTEEGKDYDDNDGDSIELDTFKNAGPAERGRRQSIDGPNALQRVVSGAFVLGGESSTMARRSRSRSRRRSTSTAAFDSLPQLSDQVTIGRNSNFHNLTPRDREELGGVEYRSLKLLLKITLGYFFGLHLLGALCLAPWIVNAPAKYREYLASQGQGNVWWAFYSAQTMVDNLGFTLTPDSMISFRDATWPMLVMSFLAFAGNTCYPILLRCVIWIMYQLAPDSAKGGSWKGRRLFTGTTGQSLRFLLDHPRRCYTLLFPGNVTWILFGILFALNFVDTLIIILCDLHTPEVTSLAPGSRILAAIFQAASSRHTGTSTFNLAKVSPAVQFSLLVMMYVSIFPIAISVRASNTYEESALGTYSEASEAEDNQSSGTYLMNHVRGQLSFDLWYIFLGTFIICIVEAGPIGDPTNYAFSVFAILFEVTSAYGNVGLSLGTNSTYTSLSGDFHTLSKLVICAMMIRGRHRGLPYALDRAVMLPSEGLEREEAEQEERNRDLRQQLELEGQVGKSLTAFKRAKTT